MTPHPFYHSLLFWLGLPMLVFLLWGWGTSYRACSGAEFPLPHNWGIGQIAGEVHAVWNPDALPDWRRFRTWHVETLGMKTGETNVPFTLSNQAAPHRYATIPYPAVVLAYVAAWGLALAGWQRRKSRLLKLHSPS